MTQTNQSVCQMSDCSNPTDGGYPICGRCMATGGAVTSDPMTPEAIMNAVRPDPIPTEEQEEYARTLRCTYLALIGQGFTEDQALTMIGHVIRGTFQ